MYIRSCAVGSENNLQSVKTSIGVGVQPSHNLPLEKQAILIDVVGCWLSALLL